jgi:hypothetical protein
LILLYTIGVITSHKITVVVGCGVLHAYTGVITSHKITVVVGCGVLHAYTGVITSHKITVVVGFVGFYTLIQVS